METQSFTLEFLIAHFLHLKFMAAEGGINSEEIQLLMIKCSRATEVGFFSHFQFTSSMMFFDSHPFYARYHKV